MGLFCGTSGLENSVLIVPIREGRLHCTVPAAVGSIVSSVCSQKLLDLINLKLPQFLILSLFYKF
jgi:hypothetical protein